MDKCGIFSSEGKNSLCCQLVVRIRFLMKLYKKMIYKLVLLQNVLGIISFYGAVKLVFEYILLLVI